MHLHVGADALVHAGANAGALKRAGGLVLKPVEIGASPASLRSLCVAPGAFSASYDMMFGCGVSFAACTVYSSKRRGLCEQQVSLALP